MLIVPATQEAEAGPLQSKSSRPAWAAEQDPVKTNQCTAPLASSSSIRTDQCFKAEVQAADDITEGPPAPPQSPPRRPQPRGQLTEKASCFCAMSVFLSLQSYSSSSSSQSLIHMISRDVAWMMFCSCRRWSIRSKDAFCTARWTAALE